MAPDQPWQKPSQPIAVLLIDDHPVIATGLRIAFSVSGRFALCGASASGDGVLRQIETLKPGAAIVDLILNGAVDTSLVRDVRCAMPNAAIVVFSSLPEDLYGPEAIAAGADAFVSKKNDLAVLVDRLSEVVARRANGVLAAPHAEPRTVPHTGPPASLEAVIDGVVLTSRERMICVYLAAGLSVTKIAEKTGLSSKTVAAHRDNIRRKFSCQTSAELVFRLVRAKHELENR